MKPGEPTTLSPNGRRPRRLVRAVAFQGLAIRQLASSIAATQGSIKGITDAVREGDTNTLAAVQEMSGKLDRVLAVLEGVPKLKARLDKLDGGETTEDVTHPRQ